MAFNWTCPYCNTKTTINWDHTQYHEEKLSIQNKDGYRFLRNEWIVCPNEECNRITLTASLYSAKLSGSEYYKDKLIQRWRLIPNSFAKSYPDYIPSVLRNDYEEASKIIELSPKASATLARRCLQGLIRDFWGVSKSRLIDEINAIEDKVDPLTWKSIDSVRKVGNIGAHLEKDINLILDIEPQEAILLIQLIELLFEEWYVHRHERELKLNAIVELAAKKEEQKNK